MPLISKWLSRLMKMVPLTMLIVAPGLINAQGRESISLSEAIQLAQSHYPLLGQKELVQLTEKLNLRNINTAFLPQPTINGQATYQSDVTGLSIPLQGFSIPSPGKDQYRIVAGVEQLVYDGGLLKTQK